MDERQHGAMDSTLVSGARDPSSNPGGIQSREKVTIGVEEKAMNEGSRVMIIAVFLCKNGFFWQNWLFFLGKIGFLSRPYLSGNSIDFLPLLCLPGYRRISPLFPYNFILRTSRLLPNQFCLFLPLYSRLGPEPPVGAYAGNE